MRKTDHLNWASYFFLTSSGFSGISFYIEILTILGLDSMISGFSAKMLLRYRAGSLKLTFYCPFPYSTILSLKMLSKKINTCAGDSRGFIFIYVWTQSGRLPSCQSSLSRFRIDFSWWCRCPGWTGWRTWTSDQHMRINSWDRKCEIRYFFIAGLYLFLEGSIDALVLGNLFGKLLLLFVILDTGLILNHNALSMR